MQLSDFGENRNGRLIKYLAFVPHDLPPEIVPSWELAGQLSRADSALNKLSGMAEVVDSPTLLNAPTLRREAIFSTRTEGSTLTYSDLVLHEIGEIQHPEAETAIQYVKAMEYGLKQLCTTPPSLSLIRHLYRILKEGTAGEGCDAGGFRRLQTWIGPSGCTLCDAVYVPPPVAEMAKCMEQLETFLHTRKELPFLVRLAMIHYQFFAVQPFPDQNSAVGQMLLTLILCSEGGLPCPVLDLSGYFAQNREDYTHHLLSVSFEGDWLRWIRFFLTAVECQSRKAVKRVQELRAYQDQLRAQLQASRTSALMRQVVEWLFVSPIISAPYITRRCDTTVRLAQQAIDRLCSMDVIAQRAEHGKNSYAAEKILAITASDCR